MQRPEIREQRSEVRDQRSEFREQPSVLWSLTSALCFHLPSVLWPLTAVLCSLFFIPVYSQQSAPSPNESNLPATAASSVAPASSQVTAPIASDERYRIGPGDILDIKVFGKPQFNREGVRVDPRGMIRMPLIKQEIEAACHTEAELEALVTESLKEYVLEPQVTVQIKEYQSEPVAVLGAVRTPSRFQLQRRVRLLELLTFVAGPAENAGRTVQVVHAGPRNLCGNSRGDADAESVASVVDSYQLTDTLRGDEKSNPFVQAGDVVSIAVADQVYVIGNVVRPTAIALTEPMTVSRAIAMAGGTAMDTKKNAIHIVRQTPGTTEKKEIVVDLDAINHHKAEDVVLVANDIVDVPASGGKRLFRSLIGAVIPNVASMPVKVIP
ncbi:MAG TPA: polysaccharide biosynthesis/export family protein [Pyrinomonadaceae bacterium]|jgi:polysaccharide export outer membrane protein|nr:polysaccharide biosynthesis/export family protein [Pyrinomonadaceae bacterium]